MNKKKDIWEQARKKLANADGVQHSSTAVDDATTGRVSELAERAGMNLADIMGTDTEAGQRKTKAADLFDKGEDIRVRRETEKIERIQRLISGMDWCSPYDQEKKDYRRETVEYMIAATQMHEACSRRVSVDERIRDHVLLTIDKNMIPEKERINKREEFLHRTIIAYLGFCKDRIKMIKGCEHVSEESKKPLYQALEDTYNLAFKAIARSAILRNHDIILEAGKEEIRKLWDRGGYF